MSKQPEDRGSEPANEETESALDRRRFLQLTAAAAAVPVVGATGCGTDDSLAPSDDNPPGPGDPGDEDPTTPPDDGGDPPDDPDPIVFDAESIPQNDVLFPNANLAGEMRPESAFLAAYFADAAPKWLRVWQPTETDGEVLVVKDMVVEPDPSGYVQVPLDDLRPGEWYRYAYFRGDDPTAFVDRSLISEFRTALAPDSLEPITIAISACNGGYYDPNNPPDGPFQYPALEVTANEYFDAFIHLGDQAYLDRVFSAGGDLPTYLEAWKSYLGSRGMRDCYARAGLYCTWDDHEITDNSAVDPWSMDARDLERIRNGIDAYFKVMPLAPLEGAPRRLWRSFRWGKTVEFIMLDSRYERDRPTTGQYLSDEQMQWLKETLAASPCQFKVVGNSVPVTDMPPLFDVARNDRWEGYERQRDELLGFIDDLDLPDVYFIAGDLHLNFVARVSRGDGTRTTRTREIAVTGGNSGFPLRQDNFEYIANQPRGVLMTFDPMRSLVNVRFLNSDGTVDYEDDLTQ